MRGGHVPEHYMLSLTKKEGDLLRVLAQVLRDAGREGDFALHEDEDELLETLIEGMKPRA